MEIQIITQGKNDTPQVELATPFMLDLTGVEKMTFCVVEEGMSSGDPSVIMMVIKEDVTVYTQTSLDKFLAAANGMTALAKTRFGWVQPEGNFSLMPMEPEMRKQMLEAIKKELEEWDDGNTE